MSHWSGLGYYRRARMLHAGVREVVARYGGEVPRDADARLALPGVGRYTAGAIGSIAFDEPEPVVDGNVARVLCRLRAIGTPLGKAVTERRLWDEAGALVDGPRPGDLNQALMELGATVCTPKRPTCDACPWAPECEARAQGSAERLPVPRKKKPPREVSLAAVVAHPEGDRSRVWLVRSKEKLFGGLWGLPSQPAIEADRQTAKLALQGAGLRGRLPRAPAGTVVHVLSHRRLTVQVWVVGRADVAGGAPGEDRGWVAVEALGERGVSRLTRKLLAAAGQRV